MAQVLLHYHFKQALTNQAIEIILDHFLIKSYLGPVIN